MEIGTGDRVVMVGEGEVPKGWIGMVIGWRGQTPLVTSLTDRETTLFEIPLVLLRRYDAGRTRTVRTSSRSRP